MERVVITYQNGPLAQAIQREKRKNYTKAFNAYQELANAGDMLAEYNLARCYKQGLGALKDLATALKHYKKSADNGVAQALTMF